LQLFLAHDFLYVFLHDGTEMVETTPLRTLASP